MINVIKVTPFISDDTNLNLESTISNQKNDAARNCPKYGGYPAEEVNVMSSSSEKIFMDLMRPLLVSMKIAGLYHEHGSPAKNRFRVTPTQVYAIFVIVYIGIVTSYNLKSLDLRNGFSVDTFYKVIVNSWNLFCFANAISCYMAFHKCSRFVRFVKEWGRLHQEGWCSDTKPLKLYVIALTVLTWITVILHLLSLSYASLFSHTFDFLYPSDMLKDQYAGLYKVTLLFVSSIFPTCAWVFPLTTSVVLCIVSYREMSLSNACLEQEIKANNKTIAIEPFRQRHLSVCQLIARADETFSFYHAMNFAVNLIICCLVLYNLTSFSATSSDGFTLAIYVFWAVAGISHMAAVSLAAGSVNHAVSVSRVYFHHLSMAPFARLPMRPINSHISLFKNP